MADATSTNKKATPRKDTRQSPQIKTLGSGGPGDVPTTDNGIGALRAGTRQPGPGHSGGPTGGPDGRVGEGKGHSGRAKLIHDPFGNITKSARDTLG